MTTLGSSPRWSGVCRCSGELKRAVCTIGGSLQRVTPPGPPEPPPGPPEPPEQVGAGGGLGCDSGGPGVGSAVLLGYRDEKDETA